MDILFLVHLIIIIFVLSIPFWSINYLRYGVYIPLILSITWILFDGCPITLVQKDLNDEYFSRVFLRYIKPNITNQETARISYFILLVITYIGMYRLCNNKTN
jgi:hypothetical protein